MFELSSNKVYTLHVYRTATIRRKLRKVDPFRPVAFAKLTQQQFIDVNTSLQRYIFVYSSEQLRPANFTLSHCRNKDKRLLRDLITENALEVSFCFINDLCVYTHLLNSLYTKSLNTNDLFGNYANKLIGPVSSVLR